MIEEKKSRRGKIFYSCSRYPDCKFALWDKPVAAALPEVRRAVPDREDDQEEGHPAPLRQRGLRLRRGGRSRGLTPAGATRPEANLLSISDLPAVNASLNALSALLLATGWVLIRQRRIAAHRACMIAALCCSTVFLTSYLYYHYHVGSVRFQGAGTIRTVYLTILLTHTVLAATVPVLAIVVLRRALLRRYAAHKKLARVALPIWLYVSVTGVVVYWMLYRMG